MQLVGIGRAWGDFAADLFDRRCIQGPQIALVGRQDLA